MDDDLVDTYGGHPRHELLPALALVERYEETELRAGEQEIPILEILPHHVHVAVGRQIPRDRAPRLAKVAREVDVRAQVVIAVAIERDICRGRVEVRCLDARDVAALRSAGEVGGNVRPASSVIPSVLKRTVVGADPKESARERRFGNRRERTVIPRAVGFRENTLLA